MPAGQPRGRQRTLRNIHIRNQKIYDKRKNLGITCEGTTDVDIPAAAAATDKDSLGANHTSFAYIGPKMDAIAAKLGQLSLDNDDKTGPSAAAAPSFSSDLAGPQGKKQKVDDNDDENDDEDWDTAALRAIAAPTVQIIERLVPCGVKDEVSAVCIIQDLYNIFYLDAESGRKIVHRLGDSAWKEDQWYCLEYLARREHVYPVPSANNGWGCCCPDEFSCLQVSPTRTGPDGVRYRVRFHTWEQPRRRRHAPVALNPAQLGWPWV